jgi:hypothetical protein
MWRVLRAVAGGVKPKAMKNHKAGAGINSPASPGGN